MRNSEVDGLASTTAWRNPYVIPWLRTATLDREVSIIVDNI